jgi:arylformamidase
MTTRYLDISRTLGRDTPVWPGSPGLATSLHMSMGKGDVANATLVRMDAHTGTHVDAPLHFVAEGDELETLGLDPFVGDALVADTGAARRIDAATLEALGVPADARRLLLRTANSRDARFRDGEFRPDYAALTGDGAQWVVDRGIRLIGIDYLSIQLYDDPPKAHQVLLEAGVAILEGLDLAAVDEGRYTLICLPIRLLQAEAAPARAILLPPERA